MNLVLPRISDEQPPIWMPVDNELHAAIASLSLGGAERIILDWSARAHPKWKVHLIVLRDRKTEWPVPPFVRVTRLHGKQIIEQLRQIGKAITTSKNPVCLAHLLKKEERDALAESGAHIIPVLHNAKDGWPEDISSLCGSLNIITVSDACAKDLVDSGWEGNVSVIRHIPPRRNLNPGARQFFRTAWNIPNDAAVIGMIGAVKNQKNYSFALRVLKALHKERDAYLVIVGGPVANHGHSLWQDLVEEIHQLDLRHRVSLPGFIPNAACCLPAFDAVMNTSKFEGLSIATLEALMGGLPVVATRVGGQGEIGHEGLALISEDAPEKEWMLALIKSLGSKPAIPSWANFPAYRLWTLAQLAYPNATSRKVLFVTANLNSGGAQRSLVNLAKSRIGLSFEILVCGNSTSPDFYRMLKANGVKVTRAGDIWDTFSFAETIVAKVSQENFRTVCFWNVDAKIKLLTAKSLAFTDTAIVDVSPGDSLFDEMCETKEFQKLIAFSQKEYYARLNRFILKYAGPHPHECESKTMIIPNGVPIPSRVKTDYAIHGVPRIVVNGRIAPAKFTLEIIAAIRLVWLKIPDAQLHFFGAAEYFHDDYARKVLSETNTELNKRIFFYGPHFEVIKQLPDFDVCVVLGKNQGCPNALLEALSVGLPAIGNDDGGTSEQLIHEKTGLLIKECNPEELARSLIRAITDRDLMTKLGMNGCNHVRHSFSMQQMLEKYTNILEIVNI